MVTASHNPKADDGYKVYWENGAQIIPPHDSGIAHSINQNLQPWQTFDFDNVRTHALFKDVTEEVATEYTAAIARMATRRDRNPSSNLRVAYTGKKRLGEIVAALILIDCLVGYPQPCTVLALLGSLVRLKLSITSHCTSFLNNAILIRTSLP
jgi:hypothetical protein